MTTTSTVTDEMVEHVAKQHWEYGQGGVWDRPADAPEAPFPAYAGMGEKAQFRDYARHLLRGLPAPQPVVDREALVLAGAEAIHRWDKRPVAWEQLDADNVQQYTAESEVVIDAILALLTGSK